MATKNKEKPTATIKEYRKWRNLHYGLKAAVYPTALTPFAVELIANWNTWFPADKDGTSVGIGLAMAVVATISTVLAVVKKDSALMKKVGPFVAVAIGFIAWGAVCCLLSRVLMEMGLLLIYSGCGVLGASVEDAIDRSLVKEKYEYMKGLADEGGLTKKGRWQQEMREQAMKDSKKEARRRAVE